jgi:hypothetical protein
MLELIIGKSYKSKSSTGSFLDLELEPVFRIRIRIEFARSVLAIRIRIQEQGNLPN